MPDKKPWEKYSAPSETKKPWEKYSSNDVEVKKKELTVSPSEQNQESTTSDIPKVKAQKPSVSSSSKDEGVLSGYPGKENKKYKLVNNVWHEASSTLVPTTGIIPGIESNIKLEDTWIPIQNEGRAQALNKYFKKDAYTSAQDKSLRKIEKKLAENLGTEKVSVSSDMAATSSPLELQLVKAKTPVEKKELEVKIQKRDVNRHLVEQDNIAKQKFDVNVSNTVNRNLIAGDEVDAVEVLNNKFNKDGFLFEEGLGDEIIAKYSPDGGMTITNSETISLDSFKDETDAAESLKLQNFMKNSRLSINEIKALSEVKGKDDDEVRANFQKAQENRIKLMAEHPEKYGHDLISEDEAGRFIDSKNLDLKVASKRLNDDYAKLALEIEDYNANPTAEKRIALKNKQNELLFREHEIQTQYGDLTKIENNLNKSIGNYIAKSEKHGNILGNIAGGLVKGAGAINKTLLTESINALPILDYVLSGSKLQDNPTNRKLKELGKTDAEILDIQAKEMQREIIPKLDKAIQTISSLGTTSMEYVKSKDRGELSNALRSISESLGAVAAGGKLTFFAQSYNSMQDQMRGKEFDGLTQGEKMLISAPYALVMGGLEKLSSEAELKLGKIGSSTINKIIKTVFTKDIPKDASEEFIKNAIEDKLKLAISEGVLKVAGGALIEGATEGAQSVAEAGMKQAVNELKDYEYFQGVPDLTTADGLLQAGKDALRDAKLGALGGAIMTGGAATFEVARNGYSNRIDDNKFAESYAVLTDENLLKAQKTGVKIDFKNNKISKQEAKDIIRGIDEAASVAKSIPEGLSTRDKRKSFNLLIEKKNLNQEIVGKDEALVSKQKDRINAINEELKTISNKPEEKITSTEDDAENAKYEADMKDWVDALDDSHHMLFDYASIDEVPDFLIDLATPTTSGTIKKGFFGKTEKTQRYQIGTTGKQIKDLYYATKESEQPKQEVSTESNISERQGTESGQQEVGQTEGSERTTEKPEANISDSNIPSEEKVIPVFHGGDVSDINVASKDSPLFVSEDKSQAEEYTKENEGSVSEFKIDNSKVANEQDVYDVINELGLESKEEGWDINDLNVFELLDNRFETSLSDEDISKVFSALEDKGYGAARFTDTNLKTQKQDINNIVIFNPESITITKKESANATQVEDEANADINAATDATELAKMYNEEVNSLSSVNPKDKAIHSVISKIKRDSYLRFGDANNITQGLARTYFKKDGQSIDQVAQDASALLSDDTSVDAITPEDIVEYINKYPAGFNPTAPSGNARLKAINKKNIELTGKGLNSRIAKTRAMNVGKEVELEQLESKLYDAIQTAGLLSTMDENINDVSFWTTFPGGFTKEEYELIKKEYNETSREELTRIESEIQSRTNWDSEDATISTDAIEEGATETTTFEEVKGLDTTDKTNLQKVQSFLDKAINDLDTFGKETLGMNLPVATARVILRAVKVLVDAGVSLENALNKVAADNNVTVADIVDTLDSLSKKKQKIILETITDYKKRNFSDDEIKANLNRAGYYENEISAGFEEYNSKVEVAPEEVAAERPSIVDQDRLNKLSDTLEGESRVDKIIAKGIESKFSDSEVREYLKQNNMLTDKEASDAILDYYNKKEGVVVFKDPKNLFQKFSQSLLSFKKRMFSARRFMPKYMRDARESKDASIASRLHNTTLLTNKFTKMYEKYSGNKSELIKNFDLYLRGDYSVDLDDNFAELANDMRNEIKSLQNELLAAGLLDISDVMKYENDFGMYLTRSYEIFDKKNYKAKIMSDLNSETYTKAMNVIKKQMTDVAKRESIEKNIPFEEALDNLSKNKLEDYLTKNDEETFKASKGREGSKDLTILKQREDIPYEVRMLMGEYSDPGQNFARTVMKMSALAANHKYLTDLKTIGEGKFFFKGDDARKPITHNTLIAPKGSESFNPLNGMYTTPEIAAEFNKEVSDSSNFMKNYMKVLSTVKWLKTIASVATHAKNVTSNVFLLIANGHINPATIGKAYKDLRLDIHPEGNMIRRTFGLKPSKKAIERSREKIKEYISAGVIKQSAGIGEIRDMFQDADFDTAFASRVNKDKLSVFDKLKKKGVQAKNFAEELYEAEDDFFKIVAYESEMSRYSKAMFGKNKKNLTEEEYNQVKIKVAEIVKNTFPTYSRVPGIVQMVRKSPIIGTFVAFQAESYRTAYNTIALGLKEASSANIEERKIGAQRLIGIGAYKSISVALTGYFGVAIGTGISGVLGEMTDSDDEEEKEKQMRLFVPTWSKDSDLMSLSLKNGIYEYIDFSASDPHGGINRAMNAFMKGGIDGFIDGAYSIVEPFIRPEMTASVILGLKNNQDAYGERIYNTSADSETFAGEILNYLYRWIEPGTASSVRKIIKADEKGIEAVGQMTGFKPTKVDIGKQFFFKMKDIRDKVEDIEDIYNDEYKNKEATPESIADKYDEANRKYEALQQEISKYYNAAIQLGSFTDASKEKEYKMNLFRSITKTAGFKGFNAGAIMSNKTLPLKKRFDKIER